MDTLTQVLSKIYDQQYPWSKIDKKLALSQPKVLDLIREACLIESYFGVYTAKMMELFWDDIEASSAFTVEAFEAFSHYHILRRYLQMVNYRPVDDKEIIILRERDMGNTHSDRIGELTNFMITELFAANFFVKLSQHAKEPILRIILGKFSKQEVTHSDLAFDLLAKRLRSTPDIKTDIIHHAQNFKHVGAYVMPKVSAASDDNLGIINELNKRISRLLGKSLSDTLTITI